MNESPQSLRDLLADAPSRVLDELRVIAKIAEESLKNTPRLSLTPHTFEHSKRVEWRAADLLFAETRERLSIGTKFTC